MRRKRPARPHEGGAIGLAGGESVSPVALGDARAGDPDLADLALGEFLVTFGVGDHQGHARAGPAAADRRRVRLARVRSGVRGGEESGRSVHPAAGDHHGGLGQAVAGVEGLAAEGRPGRRYR